MLISKLAEGSVDIYIQASQGFQSVITLNYAKIATDPAGTADNTFVNQLHYMIFKNIFIKVIKKDTENEKWKSKLERNKYLMQFKVTLHRKVIKVVTGNEI